MIPARECKFIKIKDMDFNITWFFEGLLKFNMIFVCFTIFINGLVYSSSFHEILMDIGKAVAISTVFYLFVAIVLFRDAFTKEQESTR
jgi:hypothetical protein